MSLSQETCLRYFLYRLVCKGGLSEDEGKVHAVNGVGFYYRRKPYALRMVQKSFSYTYGFKDLL